MRPQSAWQWRRLRLLASAHVVPPDQESQDCNSDTRHSYGFVSEDAFAGEARYDLAHHSHGGQDHNVDSGVRIKPEQVLEQQWISTPHRVEDAKMESPLEDNQ
jgi:hypothetical protein